MLSKGVDPLYENSEKKLIAESGMSGSTVVSSVDNHGPRSRKGHPFEGCCIVVVPLLDSGTVVVAVVEAEVRS